MKTEETYGSPVTRTELLGHYQTHFLKPDQFGELLDAYMQMGEKTIGWKVEVFRKKDRTVEEIRVKDFVDHRSNVFTETPGQATLKPAGVNTALKMLLELMDGEVFQNTHYAVRLKGVCHNWRWEDQK